MLRALTNDVHFFNCYEPVRLKLTADSQRPLILTQGGWRVVSTRFSPNRVEADIAGGATAERVALNQNYDAGWRGTMSGDSIRIDRLMGVVIPAEFNGRLAFSYWPPRLFEGIGVFCVAALVATIIWRRRGIGGHRPFWADGVSHER
jgi:hypothetical protein